MGKNKKNKKVNATIGLGKQSGETTSEKAARIRAVAAVKFNPAEHVPHWDTMIPFDEIPRINIANLLIDKMKHLNVPLKPELLLTMNLQDFDQTAMYEYIEVVQEHFAKDPDEFEEIATGRRDGVNMWTGLGRAMALGVSYGLMLSEHMHSTKP